MFVFAFEGELFAFIVNGDRFVLLALLPRRKPRTDRTMHPPCLNLTSSRLLRFACTIWRLAWISVSSVRCRTSTLYCRLLVWGLPDKKQRPPHHWDDLGFGFFTRDRLAAVSSPLLSVGAALSRGFSFSTLATLGRFTFSFSVWSLALLVTGVYFSGSSNRCRSRWSCARARAS